MIDIATIIYISVASFIGCGVGYYINYMLFIKRQEEFVEKQLLEHKKNILFLEKQVELIHSQLSLYVK
jgi:hypothetical protein